MLCFVQHRSDGYLLEKKLREVQKRIKSQEMEVLQPENDPSVRVLQSLPIALDMVFVFQVFRSTQRVNLTKPFLEPFSGKVTTVHFSKKDDFWSNRAHFGKLTFLGFFTDPPRILETASRVRKTLDGFLSSLLGRMGK